MSESKHPVRRFYPLTPGDFLRNMFSPDTYEDWFDKGFLPEARSMKADLRETEKEYILEAELPGFKKENISVEYKDNRLLVSAKKEEETKEEKENYLRRERHYGEVSRRFWVEGIKDQEINAEYKEGILKVIMPKAEPPAEAKSKIEVK